MKFEFPYSFRLLQHKILQPWQLQKTWCVFFSSCKHKYSHKEQLCTTQTRLTIQNQYVVFILKTIFISFCFPFPMEFMDHFRFCFFFLFITPQVTNFVTLPNRGKLKGNLFYEYVVLQATNFPFFFPSFFCLCLYLIHHLKE